MKLISRLIQFIVIIFFIISCSTTHSVFVPQKPLPDKSIVVGAVLVENTGIDDLYESKRKNINVIIVGKSTKEGETKTKGYRLKTDKNGYFSIQNVDPVSYVLKGIEVDVGYADRRMITSRWEGKRQIFINEGVMVDFNVRHWPEETDEKVINMGIHYFKLDNAGRIFHNKYTQLKNTQLFLEERYTMPKPPVYFKQKYPNSEWFD
ncbi:MAG: hypothetical protein R6V04_00965 [bacterium]